MSAPLTLRPYQLRAIADVRQAFKNGAGSVCLQLPTGGGKTATVATGVIGPAAGVGQSSLFVADLEEILLDTAGRFEHMGLAPGLILDGKAQNPDALVQVASQQTLASWMKRGVEIPDVDWVVLDECHIAGAATVRALLQMLRARVRRVRRTRVLGLTATPARGDGQPLDEFEVLVQGPQPRELVELGALVPCEVLSPPGPQDGCAMDPVEAVRLFASDRRAIVFAPTNAEAARITAALCAMGQPALAVLDDTAKAVRRQARARMLSGEVRHLVTVRALQKGFDLPLIDTVITTTVGTITDALQRFGRGARPSPETGKTNVLWVDLRGAVYAHGMPYDDRTWTLSGKQGRETLPNLRRCLDCHAVFPPAVRCPRCGSRRVSDPRPLRIQQAELIAQSGVPASVRAEQAVQTSTAVILRRKPNLTSSQARFAALMGAPAWVREALGFNVQEVRRAAR